MPEIKIQLTVRKITFGKTRIIVLDPGDEQDDAVSKLAGSLGMTVPVTFEL